MIQPQSNLVIPARLITIPVSHYCEKARWALMRLHVPFTEERHMPPFHRFATRQMVQRTGSANVSDAERNLSPINRSIVQLVGGQSVPVLVTESVTLTSSDQILRYLDTIASDTSKFYPTNPDHLQQVETLVNSFDRVLAPAVRQWTYSYILNQADLVQSLWCDGVPGFERLLFPVMFPWLRSNVLQMYAINETSTITAYNAICKIFETVDRLLANGRVYLVGDQFSAADLTFATLAAAVVVPVGYGVQLPALSQLPIQMAAHIQEFRETLAGKFVLRLYQEHKGIVQKKS
jgi:glutathione S-transferase